MGSIFASENVVDVDFPLSAGSVVAGPAVVRVRRLAAPKEAEEVLD